MTSQHTSLLVLNPLPRDLTEELDKLQYNLPPNWEFAVHTVYRLEGSQLRLLFSAFSENRNRACGELMSMIHKPASERDMVKWYLFIGSLQNDTQKMLIIAEHYNRTYATTNM